MQILLHSDPNPDGGHLMADHLRKVVQDAMVRLCHLSLIRRQFLD